MNITKNYLNSINSFDLLEKLRYEAPINQRQITNLNPSNITPNHNPHKVLDCDKNNNPYQTVAHINYVKKDTPPYYGVHETGAKSISYNDYFKIEEIISILCIIILPTSLPSTWVR